MVCNDLTKQGIVAVEEDGGSFVYDEVGNFETLGS